MVCATPGSASVHSAAVAPQQTYARPDASGRFGKFGGKYVPETLVAALTELEKEYKLALKDPKFQVSKHAQSATL